MRRIWLRGDAHGVLWGGSLLLLSAAACGGNDGSSLECGDGTTQQGDVCVAADAGMPHTGSDSGMHMEMPADSGMTTGNKDSGSGQMMAAAPSCGAGTIEKDGKCVADPAMKLTCGDGTVPVNGQCEVEPPPPLKLESMVISQLSMRNRGSLVADGGKLHQFYPVDVSVGITYKGDAAKIPVVFALGEPPDPAKTPEQEKDLGFCLIGGFFVDHPGGNDATETIASGTLQIPKGCLPSGKNAMTVNPIVMIDPDQTLDVTDHAAISRMVVFAKKNDVDPDMTACRIDPTATGAKGTCQVEASVEASPGLDFELAELSAESSVTVLDKCADGTDMDRPASYRCNHAIVPEFAVIRGNDGKPTLDPNGNQQIILDNDGKPVQATYDDNGTPKPKWVYGPADIDLNVTVMTYGADDSKVSNADQASGASSTDGTVNNVLADHGLQLQYSIRPAESDASAFRPLYLHKQGEQAKAGEAVESGQDKAQFEETKAVPATPHYYTHGLYVENDCGERNTATCDSNVHPRTDIVSGDWADKTDFVVKACLVPVDDSGDPDTSFDDNPDNNCRELPIKIVRHDTSGSSTNASSYGYNFQWGNGAGSQSTLRLSWDVHSWNKVDITGATVDNQAAVTLGSDLVGYTDILKGWAKGAAYTTLTGSFYDYGVSTFGAKLWGDSKSIGEFHWGKDWNVSKELRKGTIVWAGCVPIQLELRFGGVAGLAVDLDIVGALRTSLPANSDESLQFLYSKTTGTGAIGLAQLAVTPYGQITATASAAVTAGVVRVGVAGDLNLLDMKIPLTGRMWWGVTGTLNNKPVTLAMGAWADLKLNLSVMSGDVYLFAENQSLDWCSKRVKVGFIKVTVRYPCGLQWNTFWDMEIADWDGWTWNQTLWTSPYVSATVQ